jgi:hypothetical protein
MTEVIERYEHAGMTVKLVPDNEAGAGDPREWDNLGIMYCWHPDYVLGDEQFHRGDYSSMEDVVRYLRNERKALCIIPLFLLDHSGISMRAGRNALDLESRDRFVGDGAGWDTTHVGFIFTNLEQVEKMGTPPELIEDALRGEVKEYDMYLTGEVLGYVIEDEKGEALDSCWGFLGYDHAKECANEAAELESSAQAREKAEVAYWASRDVTTELESRDG